MKLLKPSYKDQYLSHIRSSAYWARTYLLVIIHVPRILINQMNDFNV